MTGAFSERLHDYEALGVVFDDQLGVAGESYLVGRDLRRLGRWPA
jgi:hypothetical protein